jgi:hypothetical protein
MEMRVAFPGLLMPSALSCANIIVFQSFDFVINTPRDCTHATNHDFGCGGIGGAGLSPLATQ